MLKICRFVLFEFLALEPANDEVEELRKEIAELKLGQGKLRDEITELRQLVQKV